MSNLGNSAEAAAIGDAFAAHVHTLFVTLVTNLGDRPVSHLTEHQCVERFMLGLTRARRARELALEAVSAEPAGSAGA